MRGERGQASADWMAVLLVVALVLGGGVTVAVGFAPWLPHRIKCAIAGGCTSGEEGALARVYGEDAAAFVRAFTPNVAYERGSALPVDFRRCRERACGDATTEEGGDVWRSARGDQATAFTRVVDRRGQGGDLFIQYWLYYPDSTYSPAADGVARALDRVGLGRTPHAGLARGIGGHHHDDWEAR